MLFHFLLNMKIQHHLLVLFEVFSPNCLTCRPSCVITCWKCIKCWVCFCVVTATVCILPDGWATTVSEAPEITDSAREVLFWINGVWLPASAVENRRRLALPGDGELNLSAADGPVGDCIGSLTTAGLSRTIRRRLTFALPDKPRSAWGGSDTWK